MISNESIYWHLSKAFNDPPFSDPDFWQEYDLRSDGDATQLLGEIYSPLSLSSSLSLLCTAVKS